MKGCLILLGLVLLALVIWAYTSNGNSFRGGETQATSRLDENGCLITENILTGEISIGINHTLNVSVDLKDSQGRIVIPSDTQETDPDEGPTFKTLLYFSGRVVIGRYTAEIRRNGRVLETRTLNLTTADSPVLNVFCT